MKCNITEIFRAAWTAMGRFFLCPELKSLVAEGVAALAHPFFGC